MNQAPAQPHTADAREHAGSLSTPGGGPCTAAAGEDRPPENTGSEPPRASPSTVPEGQLPGDTGGGEDSSSLPCTQPHRRDLPPP